MILGELDRKLQDQRLRDFYEAPEMTSITRFDRSEVLGGYRGRQYSILE
jgi:hypothetical protein